MSTLREHGTAYLAMRRSLGYKLDGHGRLLMKFIGYLEDHGHSTITTEAALAWATTPADTTQAYQNQRLSMARCFARYLSAFDPACQIPPPGLTGPSQPRPAPYLYSPEDICALIRRRHAGQPAAGGHLPGPPGPGSRHRTAAGRGGGAGRGRR